MTLPHTEIAMRAVKKPEFRERLKSDPRKTIEQAYDIRIPQNVKLRVVEDSGDRVHLVIPAKPGERGKEVGLIALILKELRTEPKFKERVIADPKGTFEKRTGLKLPSKPTVTVLEDTAELVHIHLPPASRDDIFSVDPVVISSGVWGGGGGGYGGGEPPPEPTTEGDDCTSLAGNNSSQVACCNTDIVNTVSAWDCCPEEPTDDPGGVLTPF
jgi:hypothetical protein